MTGRTYRKKGKQTFPNWTVPKRHGRLISSHAVPSIAFTMPSGLDMPAVNRCTTSVGCKTLRPRVSHRLYKSGPMGLDFTPFPHFSCSQQFDLGREILVQHEYAPKSGSTVTSCRLDLEERITMLQIQCDRKGRPSTRKMQA